MPVVEKSESEEAPAETIVFNEPPGVTLSK